MSHPGNNSFGKDERIVSRKLIETLFSGGKSKSLAAFPLRAVYMLTERHADMAPVQIMVSVPKRHFKRAVKRNRVKRQVRESYRLAKRPLVEAMANHEGMTLAVTFIWQADHLYETRQVADVIGNILGRLIERL